MIVLVAASVMWAAAFQSAAADGARTTLRTCISQAVTEAKSQNVAAEGFTDFVMQKCTSQAATFKSAVWAFDSKNKVSRPAESCCERAERSRCDCRADCSVLRSEWIERKPLAFCGGYVFDLLESRAGFHCYREIARHIVDDSRVRRERCDARRIDGPSRIDPVRPSSNAKWRTHRCSILHDVTDCVLRNEK